MNSRLADVAAYEIRVSGELDEDWFGWLDGVSMTFEPEPDGLGVTTVAGEFDQAALRGLLSYVWDLNLTVLSVDGRDAATVMTIHDPQEITDKNGVTT